MSTSDADLLPHPDETEGLLAHLASIVAARGQGPLVASAILSPEPRYFPDTFAATAAGVHTLACRLLAYAPGGGRHLHALWVAGGGRGPPAAGPARGAGGLREGAGAEGAGEGGKAATGGAELERSAFRLD